MSITRPVLLLTAAAGLALAGCGGATDDADAGAPVQVTTPATAGTADATDDATSGGDGASPAATAAAGLPERPGRDQCVDVPEAGDGRYTVYEAGTAVVTREGDRLVLGEVTAADGWTARVDHEEPTEVEIDFRTSGGEELDLEVEIDDGRVEVEICNDQDD